MGNSGFSTAGVSGTFLAFSHDGKPNVVYENGATPGADSGLPALMKWSGTQWVLVCAAMGAGGLIGRGLASRIPEKRARVLVLLLALTGGITAVGKGLWGL